MGRLSDDRRFERTIFLDPLFDCFQSCFASRSFIYVLISSLFFSFLLLKN